jgi:hypothetical protein
MGKYFAGSLQGQERGQIHESLLGTVPRKSDIEATWQRFKEIDADGDGILAFPEAVAYFADRGVDAKALVANKTWWQEMDTDNNGHLEPREFDFMLV